MASVAFAFATVRDGCAGYAQGTAPQALPVATLGDAGAPLARRPATVARRCAIAAGRQAIAVFALARADGADGGYDVRRASVGARHDESRGRQQRPATLTIPKPPYTRSFPFAKVAELADALA